MTRWVYGDIRLNFRSHKGLHIQLIIVMGIWYYLLRLTYVYSILVSKRFPVLSLRHKITSSEIRWSTCTIHLNFREFFDLYVRSHHIIDSGFPVLFIIIDRSCQYVLWYFRLVCHLYLLRILTHGVPDFLASFVKKIWDEHRPPLSSQILPPQSYATSQPPTRVRSWSCTGTRGPEWPGWYNRQSLRFP